MGTTNTTTGSNASNLQFNPIAQGLYNQLQQGGGSVLSGYMNNPLGNAAYTLGAGQSQKGAQQAGANNMAALQQNMLTSGLGGQAGAGFKQAQQAQTGRANQAMSSQANVSNVLAALQRQMSAAGTGLSYSPQLTGQSGNFNQQQSTGGLGTWLPQLLGAGLGIATGGLSSAAGGLMNAAGTGKAFGSGGVGSSGSATNLPSGSFQPYPMGLSGMGSSGLAGMMPQLAQQGGAPSPFMNMFNQPQGYNQ